MATVKPVQETVTKTAGRLTTTPRRRTRRKQHPPPPLITGHGRKHRVIPLKPAARIRIVLVENGAALEPPAPAAVNLELRDEHLETAITRLERRGITLNAAGEAHSTPATTTKMITITSNGGATLTTVRRAFITLDSVKATTAPPEAERRNISLKEIPQGLRAGTAKQRNLELGTINLQPRLVHAEPLQANLRINPGNIPIPLYGQTRHTLHPARTQFNPFPPIAIPAKYTRRLKQLLAGLPALRTPEPRRQLPRRVQKPAIHLHLSVKIQPHNKNTQHAIREPVQLSWETHQLHAPLTPGRLKGGSQVTIRRRQRPRPKTLPRLETLSRHSLSGALGPSSSGIQTLILIEQINILAAKMNKLSMQADYAPIIILHDLTTGASLGAAPIIAYIYTKLAEIRTGKKPKPYMAAGAP